LDAPPEIVARGVRGVDEPNGLVKSAKVMVTEAVANASPAQRQDETLLREYLRLELKRFIQKQTGSKPVITPVVMQI
jgi:ribonuclease J